MYGQIIFHPNTGLDRNFIRDFVVADVQNTLKVNFLTYFRLYVDYRKKLLAEQLQQINSRTRQTQAWKDRWRAPVDEKFHRNSR